MSFGQDLIDNWKKPKPAPGPTPVPVPPTPPVPPAPVTNVFKGMMFFPWTAPKPVWVQSSAAPDCSLSFAMSHGTSWENDYRLNMYKVIAANGGDAVVYIADCKVFYDNAELQMFLTNRKSPVDGHRMNDAENSVVQARKAGITRWIVSIFNDDQTAVPSNKHEYWIQQITGCYDWASADQVAWLICLEANDRFSAADVVQHAKWIKQYSPNHRVIVGAADVAYLKSCYSAAKAGGIDLELWLESATHPVNQPLNVPSEVARLKDLLSTSAKVWWGEAWGSNASTVDISPIKALPLAGYGSWKK